MSAMDLIENETLIIAEEQTGADLLRPLVEAQLTKTSQPAAPTGVIIGELVGMKDEGRTPLVTYSGQLG